MTMRIDHTWEVIKMKSYLGESLKIKDSGLEALARTQIYLGKTKLGNYM